jgi:hypothetical protein
MIVSYVTLGICSIEPAGHPTTGLVTLKIPSAMLIRNF